LSATSIITAIPCIGSDTEVIIFIVIIIVVVVIVVMTAAAVVLIFITSLWFGTFLCMDATFTSTGLDSKEAYFRVIAKEPR
jgi:hypothetical protein